MIGGDERGDLIQSVIKDIVDTARYLGVDPDDHANYEIYKKDVLDFQNFKSTITQNTLTQNTMTQSGRVSMKILNMTYGPRGVQGVNIGGIFYQTTPSGLLGNDGIIHPYVYNGAQKGIMDSGVFYKIGGKKKRKKTIRKRNIGKKINQVNYKTLRM